MANTWPGLNSSSLAVGLGAREEEKGDEREERRWEESRDSPLWVSPTSPHFVLMGDKSHSEHKVPMAKLDQARPDWVLYTVPKR